MTAAEEPLQTDPPREIPIVEVTPAAPQPWPEVIVEGPSADDSVDDSTDEPPADPPAWRTAAWVLLAAGLVLLTRAWLVPLATNPIRNLDEVILFNGALDPWTGSPATNLVWPGGVLRLVVWAAVPIDFLLHALHAGGRPTPGSLAVFLGTVLRDPLRGVGALRWVVVAISTLGFATLYAPVRRESRSRLAGVLAVLTLAAVPLVWQRSVMGVPDAVSWSLATAAFALAAGPKGRGGRSLQRPAWAGLLAGIALGSKLTSLYLLPLVVIAALHRSGRKVAALAVCVALVPVGFYLAVPYVVSDPVRLAKTVLGSAIIRPGSPGWANVAHYYVGGVPVWITLIGLAGFTAAAARRQWWAIVAAALCLAAVVATTVRTPQLFEHYFTPLSVLAVFLGFAYLPGPMRRASTRLGGGGRAGIAVALAATFLLIGWLSFRAERALDRGQTERYAGIFQGSAAVLADRPTGVVLVPVDHSAAYVNGASSDSLRASADRLEAAAAGGKSVEPLLLRSGFGPVGAAALGSVANEDERAGVARYRLMAAADPSPATGPGPGYDLKFFATDPELVRRFGLLSVAQATAEFRQTPGAVLVLPTPDPALGPPSKTFGGLGDFAANVYLAAPTPPATTRAVP